MAATAVRKPSILFVCFANTCRSTMAEAIFLHLISQRGERRKWKVDSAGISDYSMGMRPNPYTLSTLQKNGIPVDDYNHIARLISDEDFSQFDIIFGMDDYNIKAIKELRPPGKTRADIQLLGTWDPQGERIIYDPLFSRRADAFEIVYAQCHRSLTAFLSAQSNDKI